jgi:hypothetical protein
VGEESSGVRDGSEKDGMAKAGTLVTAEGKENVVMVMVSVTVIGACVVRVTTVSLSSGGRDDGYVEEGVVGSG